MAAVLFPVAVRAPKVASIDNVEMQAVSSNGHLRLVNQSIEEGCALWFTHSAEAFTNSHVPSTGGIQLLLVLDSATPF